MPNPSNPQAWNRFGYVLNNPVNFNDPSGHIPCLDGIFCGTPTNSSYQNYVYPVSSDSNSDSSGNGNFASSSGGIVSPLTQGPACTINSCFVSNGVPSLPNIPDLQDEENLLFAAQQLIRFLDYLSDYEDIINSAKPLYKQVKYAFSTGPVEAVIDGVLYGLDDRWSTGLTPQQRLGRVLVMTVESLAIDQISNKAGTAGKLFGKKGELFAQYLVSDGLTRYVQPTTTYLLFSEFNLGLPQNHIPVKFFLGFQGAK